MDWNNLGGPLRGGGVVTGNDRDKVWWGKKKKHNDFTIYNH